MKQMFYRTLTAALFMGAAMPATAATITGTHNGLTFTATNSIVGTTSTATVAGGGNPAFFANASRYNGTVALIMAYSNGDRFICSGSLMADRQSILTAGHCVSGGAGTANPVSTTAYFYNGTDPDYVITGAQSTAIAVSDYFVNAGYRGEVIDQNDIAVLRLSQAAPLFATSYELYTGNASGQNFNVTGVGARSDGGGLVGDNLGTGRKRQGDNLFDFALGDEGIDGGLDFLGENGAEIDNVLLSDFDNGLDDNDASCIITGAVGVTSTRYCNLGRGAMEAMTAGGDSGGASFIDGKVAAITSFGLSFGSGFGDIDDDLNSTFGEFGGYVSTAYHANWINSVLAVPEPGTWALMLTGFGMTGIALRRSRRRVRVVFA
ncbi:trypsin-like serine protease [Sphingomonas sp. CFBP 8760]|uniref:trypsin-like serine protease n=1 Tax=Sphingomonas sp. CFBP 8760 TaxID=2775282 RepID=UPI0017814DBA|nr:trypsin-like serine protease [Sphingomonas sp. CFBP 8760]MBD8546416.1 trypsin-like serine protease [Sphingomonas sp. CFBP 8760]